ncbi:LutC/YkgG family protein [Paenibacillus senegalensis]|uniref:LutC/YkgG family protein n=1 Tax=Paenibacillus senegalensis TaxID=1465766 RepID=UPI000288DC7A|nr:LUD domain-containing protein [Paenibacillus senegalensis]
MGRQLFEERIHGREAFIGRLAGKLGRNRVLTEAPPHPFRGVPESYKSLAYSREEKLDMFIQQWKALNGEVWTAEKAEAPNLLASALRQVTEINQVTKAVCWDDARLWALGTDKVLEQAGVELTRWQARASSPASSDSESEDSTADGGELHAEESHIDNISCKAETISASPTQPVLQPPMPYQQASRWSQRSALLKQAEQCQLGIIWPDYAIAGSGTLALMSHKNHGRSVSLLTQVLFAIFEADQIVGRMGEVFANMANEYPGMKRLPSSINLITGPSRSADIENDLTIGVHGPGKVCAFILT